MKLGYFYLFLIFPAIIASFLIDLTMYFIEGCTVVSNLLIPPLVCDELAMTVVIMEVPLLMGATAISMVAIKSLQDDMES